MKNIPNLLKSAERCKQHINIHGDSNVEKCLEYLIDCIWQINDKLDEMFPETN